MKKLKNVSLKTYNSFGIDVKARQMLFIHDIYDLSDSFDSIYTNNDKWMFLGGGSNVLFTGDYEGTIIKMSLMGIKVVDKTSDHVYVRVNGGEEWDNFVGYCVGNNWGGIENLSLIPGSTGAAPIQNIGAYGVELKDSFYCLEAMQISDGTMRQFNKQECGFGYRTSVFKTRLKDKYIICSVVFKLNLNHKPELGYKAINDYFKKNGAGSPTIDNIRRAVIQIRKNKLPDPKFLGNAGSFFKNPVVTLQQLEEIKKSYPGIIAYPDSNNYMKIPAGWLIEQAGWKGFRKGDAGVYEKQALVIVNYGKAKGIEILKLANMITKSVYEKFGIELKPEVNII